MKRKPSMLGIPLGITIFACLVIIFRHREVLIVPLRDLKPRLVSICGSACNGPFEFKAGEERARSQAIGSQVSRQLEIGMSRGEVESIVNQHAWVQYKCGITRASKDIYVFGSHDPEFAAFLYLNYITEGDGEYLAHIATFESYFLDNYTNGCEEILLP